MSEMIFFKNRLLILVLLFLVSINIYAQQEEKDKKKQKIVILSAKSYDAEVQEGIVIVDFWASWCGPCRKMDPILKEIVAENQIKVAKMNVDHYKTFVKHMGIITIPTMIIYKDGNEMERLVGIYSKKELLGIIASYQE